MSSLWLQFPDSYEMCKRCAGSGELRCTGCLGLGGHHENRHDRDYEGRSISRSEWVSCSSCSGTGNAICVSCGKTGSIQKSSTKESRAPEEAFSEAATEEPFDLYGPTEPDQPIGKQSEQSTPSQSHSEFSERISEIQEAIRNSGIPAALKNDWHERLQRFALEFNFSCVSAENSVMANFFIQSLAATVKSFRKEVRTTHQENIRDADIRNPTRSMDLDRDFDGVEFKLEYLEKCLARFVWKPPTST